MKPAGDVLERFWRFVEPEPNSGCWLWMGSWSTNGYGRFRAGGDDHENVEAHRFSYELATGEQVPQDRDLDHRCRVRCCVNPRHLEVVTRRENLRRSPLTTVGGFRKTHCAHGHPYNVANTYEWRPGWRFCRECNRLRSNAFYHAHHAKRQTA